jgi:hypothetical protein
LDENGQKMVEKAESEGKGVMERLDYVADESVNIWKELQISYTDFIRTTEADHHAFVQKVLKGIYDTPFRKGGSGAEGEAGDLVNESETLLEKSPLPPFTEGGSEYTVIPLPESALPLILPDVENYEPTGREE